MKKISLILVSSLVFLLPQSATAQLKVFACEAEWGALAEELGGDKLAVYVATTGLQDPHNVQARPSLIAKARSADLMICTGIQLEIGWLPILQRQSGNEKIQPGAPGYFEAAAFVPKLEIPASIDRAQGDVHPDGNPHIQTDPYNIARVAQALSQRLVQIDAVNAPFYRERYQSFTARWQEAIRRWEAQAAPLKGVAVIVHHKTWAYLEHWLGLREVATLEPKPGIEPTSAHLAQILQTLQRDPAKIVIRTPYNSARASESLAERAHLHALVLPDTIGGTQQAKDLFGLFDDIVQRLLKGMQ
ncbi:MAG: metal ABC transporter substrate-binding protein [Burkholderiales bacterium]